MGLTNNASHDEEIEESNGNKDKTQAQAPLETSVSQRTLLNNQKSPRNFSNAFGALPERARFFKFGSASASFKRLADERDEMSRSVGSSVDSHSLKDRITGVFSRKINWASVMTMSKEWIRDPMNMALFLWIFCVAVSGAILFLVMTGMLNKAIPRKSARNAWFEVNNQILNALFTLMCLYQHPKRFYHLVLLCRWGPKDISKLRKVYCKNGTYKPHEWAHMMVVVLLLHLNCFAQYALCGLNIGYKRSDRPALGVGICISVAIAAPAVAGLYLIVSPLGKDYDSGVDEESQARAGENVLEGPEKFRPRPFERRYSFAVGDDQRVVETRLQWSGGILDFWEDLSLAYLSLFCSFCVFGWNMERLGFGNMYVHIATFILFCVAPFWIFNLAAVNIDNEVVREALGFTGLVLCLFGLFYGGFWRIQMRKRFNLPTYTFCFGKPALSDCALWLFCCWCSLAQEARTGNSYDIVEDKFCLKETDKVDELQISPLPRENGFLEPRSPFQANHGSSPSVVSRAYYSPERPLLTVKEGAMDPPSPPVIQRETT